MVKTEEFLDRISTFEKLTYRTAERRLGKPFREKGKMSKAIKENFEPYLSVPRAASFAVTIRIGRPEAQLKIPGTEYPTEIIDDIIDNLELINNSKEEELRKRIKEEIYYRNFTALAKKFAPDGKEIKLVGLTITRGKKERKVVFTKKQSEFKIVDTRFGETDDKKGKKQKIEVIGILSYADAKQNKIKIIDTKGKTYPIRVPEGLMADIVKPHWEDSVKVIGTLSGKTILLDDIDKVE